MFAALAENADFFRNKLKCFIAIAPVVRLNNMLSKPAKDASTNETLIKAVEKAGPQLFYLPASNNAVGGFLQYTALGNLIGSSILQQVSDSDPGLLGAKGYGIYGKFFPAGTSFNSLMHFN